MVEVVEFRGDTTVIVKPGRIVDICKALRDAPQTSFRYLSMIAGMDYLPQSPRFGVVYTLYSHRNHNRITLRPFSRMKPLRRSIRWCPCGPRPTGMNGRPTTF